jgi:hypothetical protein
LRHRLDRGDSSQVNRALSVFRCRFLSRGSDSPYAVADIIGNQERAGTIDGDPHWTAKRLAVHTEPVRTSTGIPDGRDGVLIGLWRRHN